MARQSGQFVLQNDSAFGVLSDGRFGVFPSDRLCPECGCPQCKPCQQGCEVFRLAADLINPAVPRITANWGFGGGIKVQADSFNFEPAADDINVHWFGHDAPPGSLLGAKEAEPTPGTLDLFKALPDDFPFNPSAWCFEYNDNGVPRTSLLEPVREDAAWQWVNPAPADLLGQANGRWGELLALRTSVVCTNDPVPVTNEGFAPAEYWISFFYAAVPQGFTVSQVGAITMQIDNEDGVWCKDCTSTSNIMGASVACGGGLDCLADTKRPAMTCDTGEQVPPGVGQPLSLRRNFGFIQYSHKCVGSISTAFDVNPCGPCLRDDADPPCPPIGCSACSGGAMLTSMSDAELLGLA